MENKVTIQNIADMAGVSKSTVSRFLNQGYISDEKAAKIKKVIEKTGFQSNFFAKRLKMKRSKLIGIVLPRMDSMTVGKFLAGINQVMDPAGYQGLFLVSHLDPAQELQNIIKLQQQGVDGLLVNSMGITDAHWQVLQKISIPVVFSGQKQAGAHYVKVDDWGAGRCLGERFKALGHHHVVFAGVTEKDQAVGCERKQGFIEAFSKDHPEARVDFVETGFDFVAAYEKGAVMMEKKPTGIVCATDNIGLAVLRYLHEQRISVPQTVSVAAFGGYDVGAVSLPALTTVAFDYVGVGRAAAQGILDLLAGKKMVSRDDLPLKLLERESLGEIPKKDQ